MHPAAEPDRVDHKRPLAERMRPERLEDFVGQEHILGPGQAAAAADRARRADVDHPVGTARRRQDHAGAADRARDALRVHPVQRGAERHQGDQGGDGGRRAPAPPGPAHHSLHRRNSPLQQSAAGRVPALRGARRHHPDRRHHREPVVRSDLGAALAVARVRAARAHGAGNRDAAAARAAGGRAGGARRSAGADRDLRQRRRAPGVQHAGSGGRGVRRAC